MSEVEHILSASTTYLSGKQDKILLTLCNLLADGNTLIEDLPGVGKTTLVKFIAQIFDLKLSRIQFTNDLLPSDILGTPIFDRETASFHFHQGPIFGEIVMADELNRAPPKTQSALLQAMEEGHITIDGVQHELPKLFHVIATQNPHAQVGTYDLPESQLDRFSLKFNIGYPDQSATTLLLKNKAISTEIQIKEKISKEWIPNSRSKIDLIHFDDSLYEYIYRLLEASRHRSDVLPLSNRCGIDLVKLAKAWAYLNHREHVLPDDIKFLFPYVVGHRLVHPGQSDIIREHELAQQLLQSVSVR